MRIFLALKQRNYIGTYAGVVNLLLARGHHVRLAWPDGDVSVPEELTAHEHLRIEEWEPRRVDEWAPVATSVRRAIDYLRYLEPDYRGAVKLRARAFEKLLHSLTAGEQVADPGWSEIGLGLPEVARQRLHTIGRLVEDAMPSDPRCEALVGTPRPDLVVVSPLIDLGSAQTDIVKAARRLGIPTAMLLYSWDNLSTKGGLHVAPDRMFVWNERQRREAATLHGYPMAKTIATGAPRFDDFFRLSVRTSRAAFCGPLGLPVDRPILMYLGSSKFVVTNDELPFIASWVRRIRAADDPVLRSCSILVRPHPDVRLSHAEGDVETVKWDGLPTKGTVTRPFADPHAIVLRTAYRKPQGFYDALHHSAAVIGLNTSAALEAAVVGRPVFTLVAGDQAADGQASTLHFRYLLAEEGGCVTLAASVDEHLQQLAAALGDSGAETRYRAFAQEFLRPAGWDVPASQVLVDAIEREFGPGESTAPR
jgi:hypothetical protein